MDKFTCPVCTSSLHKDGRTLVCENRHCYDISKHGYVNLLMSQKSSKKRHGDDKAMIMSRQEFLNKNYYKPLLDCITELVTDKADGKALSVLDVGCGECYYSSHIRHSIPNCEMYGIDISKDALIFGHRRDKNIMLAAAGCTKLPFADKSFDVLLNIFSPTAADEYRRVLKDNGILIRAVPLENHLFSLKAAVYDTPYRNNSEHHIVEGFALTNYKEIKYILHLNSSEDIIGLFRMTPYYYKTSRTDQLKLESIDTLNIEAEFGVDVFTKA